MKGEKKANQEPNSESMGTSPHLDLQVRKAISRMIFSSSSWVWGGEGNLPAEDQEEKRLSLQTPGFSFSWIWKGNNSDRKSPQIKWDFYIMIFHGVCKTDFREFNTKSNSNKIISRVYSNELSTQK